MAATKVEIRGIVPVLVAPFTEKEDLELGSVGRLVDFAVKTRSSAVCLPAYGTEFYKLDMEERYQLVEAVVHASRGRIPVIAQSNHVSIRHAREIARRNVQLGADAISIAIPRVFGLRDEDIFRFLTQLLEAVPVPVLVQDFNPGGPTVSAKLVKRIHEACPNFRYLKLEEPLMAEKVREIQGETQGGVGVLEGWGGLYMLELVPAGICGAMPGLALADVLQEVFDLAQAAKMDAALALYEPILPHISFSMQNMELFLHMEKLLLHRRGFLSSATVRAATYTPDPDTLKHIELLTRRVMRHVEPRVAS